MIKMIRRYVVQIQIFSKCIEDIPKDNDCHSTPHPVETSRCNRIRRSPQRNWDIKLLCCT